MYSRYGVCDFFISSIICGRNNVLKEKVRRVDFLHEVICEETDKYALVVEMLK